MLEKFGQTFVFVLFLFIFLAGMNMLAHYAAPQISKVSASLADSLTL